MFGTLLSLATGHFDLLAHPALLWGLVAAVFGVLLIVFQGAFVAFVSNRYVLMGLAVAGALLAFVSMQHQVKDVSAQLATSKQQTAVAQVQTQSATDGAAAVTFKSVAQSRNAASAAKIAHVIAIAPKGTAVDSVLDEIATEDGTAPAPQAAPAAKPVAPAVAVAPPAKAVTPPSSPGASVTFKSLLHP